MNAAQKWELEALRFQLSFPELDVTTGGWSDTLAEFECGRDVRPKVGWGFYKAFKKMGLPPVPYTGFMLRKATLRLAEQKRIK